MRIVFRSREEARAPDEADRGRAGVKVASADDAAPVQAGEERIAVPHEAVPRDQHAGDGTRFLDRERRGGTGGGLRRGQYRAGRAPSMPAGPLQFRPAATSPRCASSAASTHPVPPVVKDLQAQGLVEKIEDYPLSVGTCQRCKTVVEPLLSTQWFLKMKPLAEPAIRAVEDGRIRIVPENYKKVYLDWMYRIYDWCISRQIWWGHRIPAWHCDACGEIIVARETPTACPKCGKSGLHADTDTLDTWFSSGLWPFATLGWPDDTPTCAASIPTT